MEVMTPGTGLEWSPVITGDGDLAFIAATPDRPPLPSVMPLAGGPVRTRGADLIPPGFPSGRLVTPRQVIYRTPDGVTVKRCKFGVVGRLA
jgi:hypothetical protein